MDYAEELRNQKSAARKKKIPGPDIHSLPAKQKKKKLAHSKPVYGQNFKTDVGHVRTMKRKHGDDTDTPASEPDVDLLNYLQTLFSKQSWPTAEALAQLKKQQPSGIEQAVQIARLVVSYWEKLFGLLPSNPEPNYTEVHVWLRCLTYQIFKMMVKETQSFPENYWNEFSILTQEILYNRVLLESWIPTHYQLYQDRLLEQVLPLMPGCLRNLVQQYAEEKCTDPYCIQRFPDCSGQPDKCCPDCVHLVKNDVNNFEDLKRDGIHANHLVCFKCAPSDEESDDEEK